MEAQSPLLTYHPNGMTRTLCRVGLRVSYGGIAHNDSILDRRGTIVAMTAGYNRAGQPCFRVKVAWDDGKTSTVNDYQLY